MLPLSLGVRFRRRARRRRPASAPDIVFIGGTEYQLVLFVVIVRAVTFRKVRHGPRRPDRVTPTCTRVKGLA